jgi:hypothetical protein
LRELTASQLATRSDTSSHNRLDLIQSLVPPHYVCNGYILLQKSFSNNNFILSNFREWKLGCPSKWVIKENTMSPVVNGKIGTPYSFGKKCP